MTGNLSSVTMTIEFLTMAGRGIPLEVVTKLRQKHPGSVRVVEESRGHLVVDNSVSLVVTKAGMMSEHVPCVSQSEASSVLVLTNQRSGVGWWPI